MASSQIYADSAAVHACKDPEERSRMAWEVVFRHPRVVRYIAKHVFWDTGDDAISEARIAFHEALLYTDPAKGSVFRIARWKAIRRRPARHGIHISAGARDALRIWLRNGGCWVEGDRPPVLTEEELVRIQIALYPNAENRHENMGHANQPLEPQHVDPYEEGVDLAHLLDLLDGMTSLSRDAVLAPYDEDTTLGQVGREHGLSRERIRQISNQIFASLQHCFHTP
jgi:DNA-directed RNA polymerase specialized sigma24 family protein